MDCMQLESFQDQVVSVIDGIDEAAQNPEQLGDILRTVGMILGNQRTLARVLAGLLEGLAVSSE